MAISIHLKHFSLSFLLLDAISKFPDPTRRAFERSVEPLILREMHPVDAIISIRFSCLF
jgi:hypothetical protein